MIGIWNFFPLFLKILLLQISPIAILIVLFLEFIIKISIRFESIEL